MPKLTREMKVTLNEQITSETKRCLTIIERLVNEGWIEKNSIVHRNTIQEIIEGSPYIEFHPELLNRIPK